MEREIKFRGLRTDGNGWTIGVPYFIQGEKKCFMIDNCQSGRLTQDDSSFQGKEIIPQTVGQYTGLKDKNGVEIYEGDICQIRFYDQGLKHGQVVFRIFHSGYYLEGDFGQYSMGTWEPSYIEIIGNIHETTL